MRSWAPSRRPPAMTPRVGDSPQSASSAWQTRSTVSVHAAARHRHLLALGSSSAGACRLSSAC